MPTLIQVLGQIMQRAGLPVQYGKTEMLVTISLKGGRKQVVKVRSIRDRYGSYSVLRFQSRICIAQGSAMIRAALKANAESDGAAYALDNSVTPPIIDAVYGYVTSPQCELVPKDVVVAVQRVAAFADAAEQHITGGDVF